MSDFGSVWDAADDVQADQGLRALTSARIQVAPSWSFLAAAKSTEEFSHRLALVEDRLHDAAEAHGVTVEALAKSLADDFRAQAAYFVESDGKEVGGPYDDKAAAQAAIDGGDVTGDDLSVTQGGGGDDDSDDDGDDDKDTDGDDSDSDEDQDDAEGEPSDNENPFAKKESSLDALFPVIAFNTVVHQPGETVFVDHFMGSHEHEGRKGIWATVVASPGQHGHEDRSDSHLLKPMAPGGTQFFHHFGGLKKQAYGDGPTRDYEPYYHGQNGFKSGLGSYDHPPEDEASGSAWKPHRVYDSISSAVNHLGGGDPRPDHMESYNHCNSCDHAYSTNHPEHVTSNGKDVCPNCGDTDFHETVADVLHDSRPDDQDPHYGDQGSEDNHGDPYGRSERRHESSRKTALEDGVDPLAWLLTTVPQGEGQAEAEVHHETSQRVASLVDLFRTANATE